MKNSTNQLVTILDYIALMFVSTMLSIMRLSGHPYFGIITTAAIVVTGIMIYLVHINGKNDIESSKFESRRAITWTLIGTLGAILIQIGLGFVEQNWLHMTTASQNTATLLTTAKGYPYYLVYMLICAPIMEEIIFRRVFFANLIKPTNIYWATAISSLLFAMMHQDTRFLIYLIMGAWFCFVYYRSKNIYVSAASHILMNAIVFGLSIA
ncbi:CPBP family intramembrane glutamic endopeptidase [Companilactobacillus ginsenosidimutans]|uniref:CAAX protease n=1 Tax=Companilactobacillus ginsenosidimutans TaxID=1007676 RepID=A0A0H4QEZ3_9LACO|nr:type II CAAX endopeptidase family protein [Companilactobacillus ginsenosidimutans]AKP66939.1 CAAX protease [Companilactobacillus ginsenosidimutans]